MGRYFGAHFLCLTTRSTMACFVVGFIRLAIIYWLSPSGLPAVRQVKGT